MTQRDPIDWSKVIVNRAPPVRPERPQPREHEVFDLFGPEESDEGAPPHREPTVGG